MQVVEACMARMQEQALHAGLDSSSHLQVGLAGMHFTDLSSSCQKFCASGVVSALAGAQRLHYAWFWELLVLMSAHTFCSDCIAVI